MAERRGTRGLELWCKRMTEGYPGVRVDNMTTSWRDGLAFCAIIHHFRPDLIDFTKLDKNDIYHNNELAFRVAEKYLGIPALLEPEDMVEYTVPDRLSILTYLSQFYQVFVVDQGHTTTRISPKRPQTTPDHSSIVSQANSVVPPKKVTQSGAGIRREPCAKCGLPVFIAERLNVGKSLYHRTCFRCARCSSQLTLANYYETENNEYCCETCPDEEKRHDKSSKNEVILNKSLSDEEKSASLTNKLDQTDSFSANFESALEFPLDNSLKRNFTLNVEQGSEYEKARSQFVQSQINSSSSSSDSSDSGNKDESEELKRDSENVENIEPSLLPCSSDSGLFSIKLDKVNVNIDNNSKFIIKKEEPFIAESIVTKEQQPTIATDKEDSSLVKADETQQQTKENAVRTETQKSDVNIENTVKENNVPYDCINNETDDTSLTQKDNNIEENKHISKGENVDNSFQTVSDDSIIKSPESIIEISDSIIEITSSPEETIKKEPKLYPDDLNPFGDSDEEASPPKSTKAYDDSLNPFGDTDEDDDDITSPESVSVRKKLYPTFGDREIAGTPKCLSKVFVARESILPPQATQEKAKITPVPAERRKVIEAPRISLNPFWSDDEENEDRKPAPKPRTRHSLGPEEERERGRRVPSPTGSTTTLCRKKKPAPKPPGQSAVINNSVTSSPSSSAPHSPSLTPKTRKLKKAPPPPPSQASTPQKFPSVSSTVTDLSTSISPIQCSSENIASNLTALPENNEIKEEKLTKDEMNELRKTGQSPTPSETSTSLSTPNKSTFGKWKRRKGLAPPRPIPQRRETRALPLEEIKRELDIIETQQQGLEKQGVVFEKMIREKTEGVETLDDKLSAEVEELELQLFEVVNEKNELFRKQAELMYLRRQQRLEEEHADVEYQIRCLIMQPEANKTDSDKAKEEELINRLVEIVERRNEIIQCLEMDRVRETKEDDSISTQMKLYTLKRDVIQKISMAKSKILKKDKKKHKDKKKEKKSKTNKTSKVDADKDIDESETPNKEKKKKKFNLF